MRDTRFSQATIDDLMRVVAEEVLRSGQAIQPTKGEARELTGVILELTNPRARLSRTETRGKAFSCLGELFWYLSGGADLSFIRHYLSAYPAYGDLAKQGLVYGAYGPRMFDWDGVDQIENVIRRLKSNRYTRKAVVQIFSAHDLPSGNRDIPCTCSLQFLIRQNRVCMLVNMRSNDLVLGFPHDVFCFTMLQEIVACSVSADLGWYRHVVGSLHCYESDRPRLEAFLAEGWQTTELPMPPMPQGDPWPAIRALQVIEEELRARRAWDPEHVDSIGPYWADLARLLRVHDLACVGDAAAIEDVRGAMACEVYHAFIDGRASRP